MQELDAFTCPLQGVSQIEASAGTGKTWTICALYLRLLLEKGLKVDAILVVTFTRAATAELQNRIRSRLAQVLYVLESMQGIGERTTLTGDVFIDALLTQVLGVHVSYEEACLRLEQAIQSFDQAAICTIHGFCQRALQEMPFAAVQPFAWTLTEEDEILRLEEARTFWRHYVEPAATDYPGFCAWLLEHGASLQSLDQALQKRLRKPFAVVKFPALDACAPDASEVNPELTHTVQTQAALEVHPMLRPLLCQSSVLQNELAEIFVKAKGVWQQQEDLLFTQLQQALPHLHGRFYTEDTLAQARSAWSHFFAQKHPHTAPEAKAALLSSTVLASRTKKDKVIPQHVFFLHANALLAHLHKLEATYTKVWLGLMQIWLEEGPKALQLRKQALGVMAFDDLLSTLHRGLKTQPELVRALTLRYHAALIDEFQDTDPLQWSIFQTIFAPAAKQTDTPATLDACQTLDSNTLRNSTSNYPLFLVGDPKQAIYSFRSADLHTYLTARDSAKARYTLGTNQRSTEALVTACNQIFTAHPQAFVQEGLEYQAVKAGAAQRLGHGGQAGLWVWTLPEDPILSKPQAMHAAAQACAAHIAHLLTTGEPTLPILVPSAIAVLVKTHAQGYFMKQVLAQWGIASIEMTQACVLSSRTAQELEYVMRALYAPQNIGGLRAALSLDWFGLDADTLAPWLHTTTQPNTSATGPIDAASAWVERFIRYKALWEKKGWPFMWRTFLQELGVLPRIAASEEGERRLTDLGHINELIVLHTAQRMRGKSTPLSVLRWFAKARYSGQGDANQTQLRLESDRECVQILTIHRAKGLEYDVVFCPFIYDGRLRAPSRGGSSAVPQALEYHNEAGQVVLDYRFAAPDTDVGLLEENAIEADKIQAIGAEAARLIYVALTRAVYRCYMVAGLYTSGQGGSTKEARQSVLNWLVAGPDACAADTASSTPFCEWIKKPPEAKPLLEAWNALSSEAIALMELPSPAPDALKNAHERLAKIQRQHVASALPKARRAQRTLYVAGEEGKITSFSGLTQNLPFASEFTSTSTGALALEPLGEPTKARLNDILNFPRGARAGACLHRLFEWADFAKPSTWSDAILQALSDPLLSSLEQNFTDMHWPAMMARLLHDISQTPLEAVAPDFTLAKLTPIQQRREFAFLFPAALSAAKLAPLFTEYGYADLVSLIEDPLGKVSPASIFGGAAHTAAEGSVYPGYVRGFVDLIFEHAGRFWIVDWKSTHLGHAPSDYARPALHRAMVVHHYHVQAGLYSLALHRYLKRYIPDYHYETHFGGYIYFFVRGTRPTWKHDGQVCGIYADKPKVSFIQALDTLCTLAPI